ncbi:Chemotaxis protein CheY homolog [Chlamydiales bacterium SCGC AG-110-P3]|nr:Chemotaxis protein CheY homolog [Chlamydiales bacterium SCGC AG-110-P3]
MKILLVDDSKTMRMIIQKTLREAGFGGGRILEAANGMEGLELVKNEKPSLILSDWNMPLLNGIKFLGRLNDMEVKIPFGFVTSEGTESMMQQAKTAGARFYITKPFTADRFKTELSKIL